MSDLPPGWARTSLGEVLERIETGKSFSGEGRPALPEKWGVIKVSAMTYGSFRENENKAVREGTAFSEAAEIKPGDLLLSRANTRDYVGASVLVGNCRPRLLLSDKSLRLVPTEAVDRRWLWYALSSPTARQYMSNASSGVKAGMRNISQDLLRSMPLVIPPLEEQRRIVATLEDHLSRLDAGGSSVSRACQRIPTLRSAVLVEAWRAAVDSGAPMEAIGEIAETRLGKMLDAKRSEGIPTKYLRNINIRWQAIDTNDLKLVPLTAAELSKFDLKPGDMLVCEGGEPGRCAVWQGQRENVSFQKALHRIRIRSGILPEWVSFMLEYAVQAGTTDHLLTGSTIKHLPQEKLRSIRVPVPDIPQQLHLINMIASAEDRVNRLRNGLSDAQARSFMLRRALLADAFTGWLVPQDPTEEPASMLLERIRAERAVQWNSKHALRTKKTTQVTRL